MPRIRVIAPDIASTVVPREDYPKWKQWQENGGDWKDKPFMLQSFRVNGYYCPKTPPIPGQNWKLLNQMRNSNLVFEKMQLMCRVLEFAVF